MGGQDECDMKEFVNLYGGVLSLFVKFSGSEKIWFVKFHVFIREK